MPRNITVTFADGSSHVYQNAPDNLTPEQVSARAQKDFGKKVSALDGGRKPVPQGEKPTSFMQGVKEGLAVPILNAGSAIEAGLDKIGIREPVMNAATALSSGLDRLFGVEPSAKAATVDEARANVARRNAMAPTRGSGFGKFVGNVAGTLPTAMLPGGVMAQGAASGALLTDKRDPTSIATNAALGAIGGKIGEKVTQKVANAFAPKVNQALSRLSGVEMSPGQIARAGKGPLARMASGAEDRMTSLPGPTGTAAIAAREKASEDFVKGALNESLGEIGQKLPGTVSAGHEAVKFAQQAASKEYDDALSGMVLKADDKLVSDLTKLVTDVGNGGLSDDFAAKFQKTAQNVVGRRAQGDTVDGQTLKTIISELRKTESKYAGTRGSEGEYGDAIGALADMIEDAAIRSSPKEAAQKLLNADKAYAKLVRIEGAAKMADDGIFSPAQLMTAIRQADKSTRKRAVAAGEGLMQDYAQAGKKLLPSKIGSSGTAERQGLWNPLAWGADLLAYYPYVAAKKIAPTVAKRANRQGNAMAQNAINKAAPGIGLLSAAAVSSNK